MTKYIYLLHDEIDFLSPGIGLLCFFGLPLKAQKNKIPSEPCKTEAFY